MNEYVDVTVDVVHADNFRYRVRTNADFPDAVDILYQELEGKVWVIKGEIRGVPRDIMEKIIKGIYIVYDNSSGD